MEINVLVDKGFNRRVQKSWLKGIAEQILIAQGVDANVEISLVIGSQEKVQQLNSKYLGKDKPTDVLAFSMLPQSAEPDVAPFVSPPDQTKHLGEVIISYPQAVIQAEEQHHSVKRELTILIIHGVLHLLGYDDVKPQLRRQMRAREAEILGNIEGR